MDTFQAIQQRRSVKHYDPNYAMPAADLDKILEAAMLSPTSFNIQNWRFVVVQDKEKRQAIKNAAWGQAQVTDASVLIIICADLNAHENAADYWVNAPVEIQEMIVPMISKFYSDNDQLQRDEAIRSGGIAAQTLMLAAKALGYDSCPMIGFDPEKVAEIINLPDDHIIPLILPIGKAVKPAQGRSGPLSKEKIIFKDSF